MFSPFQGPALHGAAIMEADRFHPAVSTVADGISQNGLVGFHVTFVPRSGDGLEGDVPNETLTACTLGFLETHGRLTAPATGKLSHHPIKHVGLGDMKPTSHSRVPSNTAQRDVTL